MENEIQGVIDFNFEVHSDERGFFTEVIRLSGVKNNHPEFEIKQINHSRSSKNTLRGIHVASWNKIVYVPRGRVQCVVVDCREGSSTFGKHKSFLIGDEKRSAVFVPAGCGNSFLVLSEDADYVYFIDREWEPNQEKDLRWDDPELNIDWMVKENLSISERDKNASLFNEVFKKI